MSETAAPAPPAKPPERTVGYEDDFVLWTQEQAALIRAGRFDLVDWANVAEEIESLGASTRRELSSRLKVLVSHLLKWQLQPRRRARSWRVTIRDQRDEIRQLLEQNPSLRREVEPLIGKRYRIILQNLADETTLALRSLPKVCPWSAAQVLDEDFYPGPLDDPADEA